MRKPQLVYAIRVSERTDDGWKPLFLVEHRRRERAMRDFQWATHDVRFGPHGTRRMELLPPARSIYAGGVR